MVYQVVSADISVLLVVHDECIKRPVMASLTLRLECLIEGALASCAEADDSTVGLSLQPLQHHGL